MVIVGGGYIGMEVAAAACGWKLDTTVCVMFNLLHFMFGDKDNLTFMK